MKKHTLIIAAASVLWSLSAQAQSFGGVLGALLGAVTEEISAPAEQSNEPNESLVGVPQQNLATWGIKPANYSGITALGDGRYAVVSDKESADGFYIWKIAQDPQTGSILSVESEGYFANTVNPVSGRDCEGIVYFPKEGCVFISGEADQRIVGYDMAGQRNGLELEVPAIFRNTVGNQGLEALGFGGRGIRARFWATTETTLPADGAAAGPKAPGQSNLLRLQSFKTNLRPSYQYAYRMDAGRASDFGSPYVFGVPEVCAMPDGSVLVLEREANIPKLYIGAEVVSKLYSVKPRRYKKISEKTVLGGLGDRNFLDKQLVASWSTRLTLGDFGWANYEGMCLGAKLSDGRQTLLLISDSQGGYGKGPVRLQDFIKVIYL